MNLRYLILLTTLAFFLGFSVTAVAHPCKHHLAANDPDHPHCDESPKGNPNSESNDKVFPVKVTFDSDYFLGPASSDTIMSDGGPYIDGVNVTAEVPMEGTPPGQFLMWQGGGNNITSTLFIDFGEAEDCAGADEGTLGCVVDKSDVRSPTSVTCPIPFNERVPLDNSWCSGFKPVTVNFRHTVDANGKPETFMMDILDNLTHYGEAYGSEMHFAAEKNNQNWSLRFDPQCGLTYGTGQFLQISAQDNEGGDELLNDEWYISTGGGTKKACLIKAGNGNTSNLIGMFDMQFGYTICILANPESGNGECLMAPSP